MGKGRPRTSFPHHLQNQRLLATFHALMVDQGCKGKNLTSASIINRLETAWTIEYMRHCFFFAFIFIYLFIHLFIFWFFFFPKSAQVGLRLPDTRTSTATRVSFYSIYVYQEEGGRQEEGKSTSPKSHHKETYVPSIMEVCAPQQLAPHWLIFCWFSSDIYFEKA